MFTGIVQGMAKVVSLEERERILEMELDLGDLSQDLVVGASVACAGVCLTVTRIVGSRARFDLMAETVQRSTFDSISVGDSLNVERAARLGDEIGGHLVSGHVMGTATIQSIDTALGDWIVTLQTQKDWMSYLFSKGFIALDGCSLTMVSVDERDSSFTVHLIPETLVRTTFGLKKAGDRVNVEIDSMTQAVVDTVRRMQISSR